MTVLFVCLSSSSHFTWHGVVSDFLLNAVPFLDAPSFVPEEGWVKSWCQIVVFSTERLNASNDVVSVFIILIPTWINIIQVSRGTHNCLRHLQRRNMTGIWSLGHFQERVYLLCLVDTNAAGQSRHAYL